MSSLRAWPAALLIGACAATASAPPGTGASLERGSAGGSAAPSLEARRASVASIELCKTTETDLRGSFGPSMRDGRIGRFRVMSWLVGKDPERVLAVLLDAHGVVIDIDWDTPGDVTWIPRDNCAPPRP